MFVFLFSFLLISPSHSQVISWSVNNIPSLLLTDKIGVVFSNDAIMSIPSQPTNQIRIEDIILQKEHSFSKVFVRFKKQKIPSFVKIKIYDAFTDNMVYTHDFYEQDILNFTNEQLTFTRIYIVVELHGSDIELRSVGMGMEQKSIIDDIVLNKESFDVSTDNVHISFTLHEAAIINLLIYNRRGDVCKNFLVNKTLNPGTYHFSLDPSEFSFDYLGDKRYYVWLKATNLRSQPVELIKTIYIIP